MCRFGDGHVRRREGHPAGEGEIDEVPIDRVRRSREFEADASDLRMHVDHMRVMKRVDRVGEQPGQGERQDDQALGQRLRVMADRFGADRDQQDRQDHAGDDEQPDPIGVVRLRMVADHARLARAEQRDARQQEDDRGEVETGHRSDRPVAEQRVAERHSDDQHAHERKEARRRDCVADAPPVSHEPGGYRVISPRPVKGSSCLGCG